MDRLQGCQPEVDVWQRILQVRTLVLNPEDDPVVWIKFANLCRKSERMILSEKTINSLLSPERVCCGYHKWKKYADPDSVTAPPRPTTTYEGSTECGLRAAQVYVANRCSA